MDYARIILAIFTNCEIADYSEHIRAILASK